MTLERPDPEALLRRVMAEERRAHRGRLKVFLGYASRVGKSHRMFDEMRRRHARGQDAVIAWIQDAPDGEISALVEGLEIIPPRISNGTRSIDVEAVLRRKPHVCAVDGLAGDNPPGSPHRQRWEDVDQLLEAGIHVVTSVNVQYIEGLQDDIEHLLGVRKQASVPDEFIRGADEVVLVDLCESEVRKRMTATSWLTPRQLSTLREMALLFAADTIDRQVEDYRQAHHIDAVWGTQERILVCVTANPRGPLLVERGRLTAERLHAGLHVVYVAADAEWSNLDVGSRLAVQSVLALGRTYHAEVEVLTSCDPAEAILSYAQTHHITQIFLGRGSIKKVFGPFASSVVGRVLQGAEGIDVHVASESAPPLPLNERARVVVPGEGPRRRRTDRDRHRGHLRVYLGYAAGVGKTFQMLADANRLCLQGVDVVIGYFEPHARRDTIAQVGCLETVPRRVVEYREHVFEDMDLDAVLARHPAICLVDELAHSNIPGAAHEKRWRDVEAILQAGIDVFTTVNVQHLESLNDCVAHISGVQVRETVPDHVVNNADEVVLVDVTTRALLNRLKRGAVYAPEKAEAALKNFFKEGTLSALRELALRQTAEKVERTLHQETGVPDGVLACIGARDSGAALVRRARRLADRLGARCWAVHVYSAPNWEDEPEDVRRHVDDCFSLAEILKVQTVLLPGRDTARALMSFAREHHIGQLYMGRDVPHGWRGIFVHNVVEKVILAASEVDVHVVADR